MERPKLFFWPLYRTAEVLRNSIKPLRIPWDILISSTVRTSLAFRLGLSKAFLAVISVRNPWLAWFELAYHKTCWNITFSFCNWSIQIMRTNDFELWFWKFISCLLVLPARHGRLGYVYAVWICISWSRSGQIKERRQYIN